MSNPGRRPDHICARAMGKNISRPKQVSPSVAPSFAPLRPPGLPLGLFVPRHASFEARAPGTHTPQSRRARHTAARRPPPPKEPPRWSASDHQRMSTRRGGYRVRPRVIGLQIVEPNKLLQLEVCDLALELPRVCQGERSTPCDLVPSTRTPPRPVGPLGSILTADPCMYCTGRWVLSSVWS